LEGRKCGAAGAVVVVWRRKLDPIQFLLSIIIIIIKL
jgi:hypothetical protein